MKYSFVAWNRIRMRSGTSISVKNRQGVLSMFENRRLNRLLESGEYQLPESMRLWIADAAHWIAPLVTMFVSILVGWLAISMLEYPEPSLLRSAVFSIGMTQFLLVGLGGLWMFQERICGPECWYDLTESCALFGLTLDELARTPLAAQIFHCERFLKDLAEKVVLAEREHPGQEYHPDRVEAKHKFEKAFRHFQRVGWIEHGEGYGKFFGH